MAKNLHTVLQSGFLFAVQDNTHLRILLFQSFYSGIIEVISLLTVIYKKLSISLWKHKARMFFEFINTITH